MRSSLILIFINYKKKSFSFIFYSNSSFNGCLPDPPRLAFTVLDIGVESYFQRGTTVNYQLHIGYYSIIVCGHASNFACLRPGARSTNIKLLLTHIPASNVVFLNSVAVDVENHNIVFPSIYFEDLHLDLHQIMTWYIKKPLADLIALALTR